MNTDFGVHLKHRELTEQIIRCFYAVYNTLGYGYLESVYERAMLVELEATGLQAGSQAPVQVMYRGHSVGEFRADILVASKILLELKAARRLEPAFEAQVLNYLKGTRIEVGLLLNFGPKPEFRRFLLDNIRKQNP